MASFRVHETARTRPGRPFEAVQEAALYPAALKAAKTLPGASSGVLVVPEMFGPIGVPDFLAMVGGARPLEVRLASGIPPLLSSLDCSIVAALFVSRPQSAKSVADKIGWTEESVRSRLQQLKKLRAVIEAQEGTFTRHEALTPAGTLYAIEVKVRDWAQAVKQSRGYRTWANNYVLVFGPMSEQARRSVLHEVEADLAGLYIDGHWVRKPSKRLPDPVLGLMGFEHLVAALEGYQPSSEANLFRPSSSAPTQA